MLSACYDSAATHTALSLRGHMSSRPPLPQPPAAKASRNRGANWSVHEECVILRAEIEHNKAPGSRDRDLNALFSHSGAWR